MTDVRLDIAAEPLLIAEHTFHDSVLGEWAVMARDMDAQMALTYLAASVATNMLGQITTAGLYMSIHTASPGTVGSNEIVPGSGYTGNRPAVSWSSVASGVVYSANASTQTFALLSIQAGGIPYFGIWDHASGANSYLCGGATSGLSGSIPSGANVVFTGTGVAGSGITLTQAG
jgi:hypothetical protein